MAKVVSVDIESYSETDLIACGVYAYVADTSFEVLLIAYSVDGGPVELLDLTDFDDTSAFEALLLDSNVIGKAYNAQFERLALSKHFGVYIPPERWRCTAVHAAVMGLPRSLGEVGRVLGLPEDKQKSKTGKELIKFFCKPCKPTKKNKGRTRNYPHHDPEKWEAFKEYCKQDVVTEMEIGRRLSKYPVADAEWELWFEDQRINDRGVMVDKALVEKAIQVDKEYGDRLVDEAIRLTGLPNPNSVKALKEWLTESIGVEVKDLTKQSIPELIKSTDDDTARRVLSIRKELSKSSVSKYYAMERVVGADSRARGLLRFYGANRTGRFSSQLLQTQNLPQNKIVDLENARKAMLTGDIELIDMLFGSGNDNLPSKYKGYFLSVPDLLSQLIRTALVPSQGNLFYVADYSAIEARMLAWLSGEAWRLDVFKTHGKIYEASASAAFHVPIESIGKGNPLRQQGKVLELACIAEGSLVLTDRGLVPIEDVTVIDLVFDGTDFVTHEGVVYRGEKAVIEYDGLTATADHFVFLAGVREPVPFGFAAVNGLYLTKASPSLVLEYSDNEMVESINYPIVEGSKTYSIYTDTNSLTHMIAYVNTAGINRKVKYIGTARVYDILNAGPRHRFVVSGVLVHNCGYGGGEGAIEAMDYNKAIPMEERGTMVKAWRAASPNIVKFWWDIGDAAMKAVKTKVSQRVRDITIRCEGGFLFIDLPYGRSLAYVRPRIEPDERFGRDKITYEGIEQGKNIWGRLSTYGPKLVENITQGASRDCLAYAIMNLSKAGYNIVMHVHDEVIIEAPASDPDKTLKDIEAIMGQTPPWAEGLPLRADGYYCEFYKKE